jgi:hypothetical protein
MRMTNKRLYLVTTLLLMIGLLAACGSSPKATTDAEQAQAAAGEESASKQLPFGGSEKNGLLPSKQIQQPVTVPAGTPLTVRLQETLSSASAATGQQFAAVLDEPLVVKGVTVAPRGAEVMGRVVLAEKSGRLHDSGSLRLTLKSIEAGDRSIPVITSSVFAKGASHKKRNVALIGGGAGAGALIGGLTGGGKGALIGTAVGAGAGTGTAYATGKKDVSFAAERRLTFRLNQAVQVQ